MFARTLQLYKDSFKGLSQPVWIISIVMLINRSGTMVLPFLTVYLTTKLGFTLAEAGLVMAFFGGGSVLGSYLGGRLTDKFGYYPVQFWSIVLGGLMFFPLLLLTQLAHWCIATFLLATVADAFRPASMTAIAVYSKEHNRTRAYTLVRLAINLGWAIGPVIGGLLAATVGYSWLFIFDGLTCVAAGIYLRMALKEKKQKISENDKAVETVPSTSVRSAYKDGWILLFLACNIFTMIAFMQLFSTLPVYFKDHFLMNEFQIGLVMSINALLIFGTEMPLIYKLENKANKLRIIAIGTLCIGLSFLVFNIIGWIGVVIISILFITIGEMLNMPFSNTIVAERANEKNRGQYMGLFTISYSIAHIFAPILGTGVADYYGWTAAWYLLFGCTMLSFGGLLYLEQLRGKMGVDTTVESAQPIEVEGLNS